MLIMKAPYYHLEDVDVCFTKLRLELDYSS